MKKLFVCITIVSMFAFVSISNAAIFTQTVDLNTYVRPYNVLKWDFDITSVGYIPGTDIDYATIYLKLQDYNWWPIMDFCEYAKFSTEGEQWSGFEVDSETYTFNISNVSYLLDGVVNCVLKNIYIRCFGASSAKIEVSTITPVPEPPMLCLLGFGVITMSMLRRRLLNKK